MKEFVIFALTEKSGAYENSNYQWMDEIFRSIIVNTQIFYELRDESDVLRPYCNLNPWEIMYRTEFTRISCNDYIENMY